MTLLLPRLPDSIAVEMLSSPLSMAPALSHRQQLFAPVGGRRATEQEMEALREGVLSIAKDFGLPDPAGASARISFDRQAADALKEALDLTWVEAGSRGGWTWLACVLLPDVTLWRFGRQNRERWIASDLTRHTWSRLWWQAIVFGTESSLLRELSESDLNQLLERRTIGGDPRLVRSLAASIVEHSSIATVARRSLIRDATARLRRRLAFIDARSLSGSDLDSFCEEIVTDSLRALQA